MKSNKGKICVICLFATTLILIGIGFLVLHGMVKASKEKRLTVNEYIGKETYDKEDFYIDINISKHWIQNGEMTGAQYDGIFYNNSDNDINRWEVDIKVPKNSKIDSLWNGEYDLTEEVLHITPVDYNKIVESKTTQPFGFVMYTKRPFRVKEITVTGYKVYAKESFALYWILITAVLLTAIVTVTYIIVEFRLRKFKLRQKEDKNIIQQSLNTFANFIDAKDPYTKGHSTRVAKYTKEIARRMGMSEAEQDKISYIAMLHDVGKIGITNEILDKPGKLTDEERKVIQMHTIIGAEILKDFTALPGILEGVRYHHESFDGHGYPNGLKGYDIPLFARIICVADSYDAMASDRCYRKKMSDDKILDELTRCTGTQFDPDVVKYMIAMIKDGYVNKIHGGNDDNNVIT